MTHLSCLERLVSAPCHHSDKSTSCLMFCELPSFLWGLPGTGPFTLKSLLHPGPNNNNKTPTQPSRKERAGVMEPENISWPSHFLVLWLCRFVHMSISKGLKVVIMSPTSQDYGDLFIRQYMSKCRAHGRHSVIVKIENLKRKLLNCWRLKDTLTCFIDGGHSLHWPPASWPVGPANTPLPSQDLHPHRRLSKSSILPREAEFSTMFMQGSL